LHHNYCTSLAVVLFMTSCCDIIIYHEETRRRSESAYIRQVNFFYSFHISFGDGDGLHEGDGWCVVGGTDSVEDWTEWDTQTERQTDKSENNLADIINNGCWCWQHFWLHTAKIQRY